MSRSHRWTLPMLAAAVLFSQASAAVVVVEHSGHYTPAIDYDVTLVSWVTILRPSDPGIPYDFDCYDDVTNEPATIQAILPADGLVGTVELKVVGHDGREFGAEDIDQIVFFGNLGEGAMANIQELTIRGTLGTLAGTTNHVYWVQGPITVADVGQPLEIEHWLGADLTVTGTGDHSGSISASHFNVYTLSIAGNMLGDISVGRTGGAQAPAGENSLGYSKKTPVRA